MLACKASIYGNGDGQGEPQPPAHKPPARSRLALLPSGGLFYSVGHGNPELSMTGSMTRTRETNLRAGVYRHYKGGLYQAIGIARHSETDELMVVYVSLTGAHMPGPRMSVRPLSMWQDDVKWEGGIFPRFEYVGIECPQAEEPEHIGPDTPIGTRVYVRRRDLFGSLEAIEGDEAVIKFEWPWNPKAPPERQPIKDVTIR